ncbi:hypothetical protein EVG20_g2315 [Dentipellis fragilis]|uniref:DNA mismatch repair proteins mutS family domain-containing protein n=1 Tax=Dentipellis fragilis TaxID=205917 RepID=A0A4Y9Z856_9AGAM|nr:hypothetical protein EVG20_g2315 [Dentipellis fragilis]
MFKPASAFARPFLCPPARLLSSSSTPLVTKKKFRDLPKLPANLDGLRPADTKYNPHVDTTILLNAIAPETHAGHTIPDANIIPSETPRRRRRKKALLSTSGVPTDETLTENNIASLDGSEAKPVRRGRKPKNPPDEATGCAFVSVEEICYSHISVVDDAGTTRQPRTQLASEIQANLAKFPHCILLTRVGQFYESYFDQAPEVARLLNIKLTTRKWGGERVPMCGFPLMHLQKYLKVLVQQHTRFVALCEEFPRPAAPGTKPFFDRRVTRVVTPGTLIDEPFLNQYENNYLLAISPRTDPDTVPQPSAPVGLAWIDVSTGEFFTKTTVLSNIQDELVRISPREVVLPKILETELAHPISSAVHEEECFFSFLDPDGFQPLSPSSDFSEEAPVHDDITSDIKTVHNRTDLSLHETAAIQLLSAFLHANLIEHTPKLSSPSIEAISGRMQIDSHTIKALEIREGMREGGVTGSLLSVIKRTVTSGGTRLLARWLCSPSISIAEINSRQSLVAFFHSRPHLRNDLVASLRGIEDISRIVQKFLLGRGNAYDLILMKASVALWTSIKERISFEKVMEEKEVGEIMQEEWDSIESLLSRMDDLQWLSNRIETALQIVPQDHEDSPLDEVSEETEALSIPDVEPLQGDPGWQNGFKWTINPEFSTELRDLHVKFQELLTSREQLEDRLRRTYSAPSLTLRSSTIHGLHVHISKPKRDAAKIKTSKSFASISQSLSTSSFFHQEWAQLGQEIMQTSAAISAAEREVFETLRSEVVTHEGLLRRNARVVDEIDVTLGFAQLAADMNLVRPTLTDDNSFNVVNGRHPAVELGLLNAGRVYTPNTVSFSPHSRLHIVTGPNMAGKSTLLRQTALITILAQTGSFVPADSAVVGIVDKLFSRIGAKDDLFRDRSTFMVEMLEAADILQRATARSLVIMDEVGRGTTVKDGLAIAFAVVHHLYFKNQSRTLFATHFHELTDLLGYSDDHKGSGAFEDVAFFCTDVDETDDGHFAYSYHLRPGVNRDSHGLKVAQLAGLPPSAIIVAQNALSWLKQNKTGANLDSASLKSFGQSLASQTQPTDTPHNVKDDL